MTDTLIAEEATIRFGRKLRTHGCRVLIEDRVVRLYTRCGLPTLDVEHTVATGVVSCPECQEATA